MNRKKFLSNILTGFCGKVGPIYSVQLTQERTSLMALPLWPSLVARRHRDTLSPIRSAWKACKRLGMLYALAISKNDEPARMVGESNFKD